MNRTTIKRHRFWFAIWSLIFQWRKFRVFKFKLSWGELVLRKTFWWCLWASSKTFLVGRLWPWSFNALLYLILIFFYPQLLQHLILPYCHLEPFTLPYGDCSLVACWLLEVCVSLHGKTNNWKGNLVLYITSFQPVQLSRCCALLDKE